ncbi:hypothetical protein EG832_00705 [bacterium]|nr:hypothetical protein [bacterium]
MALGISYFLKEKLDGKGAFPGRTFYGETFTLALFALSGIETQVKSGCMLERYERMDRSAPEFHWEFNNYALLIYRDLTGDSRVDRLVFPLRMKGTTCTNWTLLRFVSECLADGDHKKLAGEACQLLNNRQLPSGLILDDKQVKSFQYHCFSAAMIYELYLLTGDFLLRDRFLRAVVFIRRFILNNGEALYIGRGQNQSFGYGTLIYILACAYKLTRDATLLDQLELVVSYLKSYRREHGNFPLVIGGGEKRIPEAVSLIDPEFAGWYPYNNYYDYLPFLGFFLAKAAAVLESNVIGPVQRYSAGDYNDPDFRIVRRNKYTAVLSRPGGYWTNYLAIPYVMGSERLMPCYGGEQFQDSLYDERMLGLPYFPTFHRSISWKAMSRFVGNSLCIASPLGIMRRHFRFLEDAIEIRSRVVSMFSSQHIYAVLDETCQISETRLSHPKGLEIQSSNHLVFIGYGYSACGRLKLFSTDSGESYLKLVIK